MYVCVCVYKRARLPSSPILLWFNASQYVCQMLLRIADLNIYLRTATVTNFFVGENVQHVGNYLWPLQTGIQLLLIHHYLRISGKIYCTQTQYRQCTWNHAILFLIFISPPSRILSN